MQDKLLLLTSDIVPETVNEATEAVSVAPNVSTGGAVYLLIVLLLLVILYSKGKKKYKRLCDVLDKEEYRFKSFTVMGFALMELVNYKYNSNLDRKLRKSLRELKEEEYVEFYLRVTWATAATYCMMGLFLSAMMALAKIELSVVVVMAVFGIVMGYAVLYGLDKKVKEHHAEIAMDLPDFINKLLILSGAGLNLKGAMIKVSKEMEKNTAFYQALKHSVYMMEHGSTVESAMDALCARCNMPEVRRMSSVLLQNIHSGGSEVLRALNEISRELWTNRRAYARQKAEEAGTKLLFPMMLMLLAVIVIVAAPAIMAMNF